MAPLYRWLTVCIIAFLLITYPRGYLPPPLHASVTSPIPVFTWAHWSNNITDLFSRIITLHFGMSVDQRPLFTLVASQFAPSLILVSCGLVFAIVFGVIKGIFDGVQHNRLGLLTASSVVQWLAESIPDFFIIITLEYLFFFLGRQHIANLYIVGNHHFIMGTLVPAFILALIPMMYVARMVRSKVDEQYGQAYLVTASAKGLSYIQVLTKHLLPNVVPTIFEASIPSLGLLFSNLMLVEYLTYRNGIVSGILDAIGSTEYSPVSTGNTPPTEFGYMPFDVNRMFLYTLGILIIFCSFFAAVRVTLRVLGWRGQRNTYSDTYRSNDENIGVWKLWVGMGILIFVVLVSVCAGWLPLPLPQTEDTIHFQGTSITTPPFPPSSLHFLGSDTSGHDLFSQTIHATLPTFAYVGGGVIVVLCVAVILAFASSLWRVQIATFIVYTWNSITTVVPSVVLAAIILVIPHIYFQGIEIGRLSIQWNFSHQVIYLLVICCIETGRASYRLKAALDDLENKTYIEAATISGNSTWSRFKLHHWRTFRLVILEQLTVLFSRILLVIATLGFLNLPISGRWELGQYGWQYFISPSDWGGILANNVHDFLSEGYSWLVFAPTLFITVTIIAMNLIERGIHAYSLRAPKKAH